MNKYVIVTPVRDEEKHIEATVNAVVSQTTRPTEWIIVNDGSTDSTGKILDAVAAQYPWIQVVHRQNRGYRKAGGGVVEAFYAGYSVLRSTDWDFVVKLDGDLTFEPDYFEKCLGHFETEPELGIGGGEIYHDIDGELRIEANPKFHVRGATKIYRRSCWEQIGGLWVAPGWDTIDEVKANMFGWKTHSFPELKLLHHRFTGTAEGLLRDRIKHGLACYISGYHPLFMSIKCFSRVAQKPYVIGAGAILYGFVKGYATHANRVSDTQMIGYLRNQQLRRLFGMSTIWK
jgi:biofilm PGA synthesis N-glycosyltransferase PgaC